MTRNHKWSEEDTIITLYFVKYELNGLPIKDEQELAEGIIGSSKASLQMQAANIRFVLGDDTNVLSCFSKVQEEVVKEYNKFSQSEFRQIVLSIINQRDITENMSALKLKKEEKAKKDKEKKRQADLDEMWRKMGKDPKKMKKVS